MHKEGRLLTLIFYLKFVGMQNRESGDKIINVKLLKLAKRENFKPYLCIFLWLENLKYII